MESWREDDVALAREVVATTRRDQGKPDHVTDPAIVEAVGAVFEAADPGMQPGPS